MKTFFAAAFACVVVAGCMQTSRYVSLSGYAYQTDPNCIRRQPPTKFDRRCDAPILGFSAFTPPPTFGNGF
ncbi:hypothetical protein J2Z31_000067 [Sinorhizobium kostiense]|uniref:Lipoprotein n=1 Tax=Sinorhizobium kostiense TaxID=76747 RepID=A0ABS4QSE9_9HYPH|nr:hypothetical protein [Sinorhizobium kostiense]MBP2233577.1 hypothetical protein [Sinorhizobium kostiense]